MAARCLIVFLLVTLLPGAARSAPADSVIAVEMQSGDHAYRSFDNVSAMMHYAAAFAVDSTRYDALWKYSRACADCAAAASSSDERNRLLTNAERLARRSVELYPDSAQAHFVLAFALGRAAEKAGGKRRISLSKEIKHEAQTAIDLDPRHAGSLHILGRWNCQLASLNWFERSVAEVIYGGVPSGASMAQARDYFERAAEIDPAVGLNHFWLGETLIELDDYQRARAELQKCIECEDVFWDDHLTRERARKRLKEIEGKK